MSLLPDEVDDFRYVERVTFTGVLEGMQISCWEIPLDKRVPAFSPIDTELPELVKTQKATISLKRKDKKAENGGSSNG
ncbi:TPA: peroxidase [Escherichia coli]|jgi:hypothetical protein|uniref:hypothetical protein n=1 Tax=Escherichia TaxID=561 RepID=UPI0007A5D557|nr:hypothetical protein [Escherichia coli]MBP2791623.1 peroxidase [Escherichia coli]RHJ15122.1 peroxidase [Escherichia coli]HAW3030021.1 peroxidase [Escherichia coli]HAX4779390.1 peroxidase [Escherichia coli]HAX5195974.1 peroxidase [Escherichia coli]